MEAHKTRPAAGPKASWAPLRRLGCVLAVVLLGLLGRGFAEAAAVPAEPQDAQLTTPRFPLEALRPGQRGYALTAGAGNALERLEIEVLALQYDVGSGFPLVLVRASGPLIEAAGGIASGMSGSPVYLRHSGHEALLGAIGYTFPETSGGLGLVTPIETMRRADPRAETDTETDTATTTPAFGPTFDPRDAVPVRTPLLLSGLSARAGALLEPLFAAQVALLPLQTTGGYAQDDAAYTLQPGGAVSVQLVRGDVTVAAVGTVTLLEDGAFWAFGHPLVGRGAVSFALAPAYVSAVVPSANVPFKLADSGHRLLGRVTQDRPYAISGLLGGDPDFIPVTLTLSGDAGTLHKRFEITHDERFYAPLLGAATLQAFDELLSATGAGTADLAWEITLRGGRTVRVLEQATSPDDLALAAAGLAGEPLALVADNPFQAAEVARIDLSATFERAQRVAEIVEVVPEREVLQVGGTLALNLRLQPYRSGPEVERVQVRLPPGLRGPLTLSVRGGLTPDEGDEARPLYSFAELLSALEDNLQASELVVEAAVEGETRVLRRLSLPYLVSGREEVEVTVRAQPGGRGPKRPDGPTDDPLPDSSTPDPGAPEPDEPPPEDDPLEERPPLEPAPFSLLRGRP